MIRFFTYFTFIISTLCGTSLYAQNNDSQQAVAYFAGGCFWCTEADFEKLEGVKEVISGFMGGTRKDPSYTQVTRGMTKYRETVKVIYDPKVISYRRLINAFWRMHDPTDANGSFVDRGRHYGSAIYYTNMYEKQQAEESIQALSKKFTKPLATSLEQAGDFYAAGAGHQDYYKTHKRHYQYYRWNSGRDQFIAANWADDDMIY